MGLSVICVYNDTEQYQRLLGLLDGQGYSYEMVGIDNAGARHRIGSAAEALGIGIERATQDCLMFVHQDIVIEREGFLAEVEAACMRDRNALFGIAGITHARRGRRMISTMSQGSSSTVAWTFNDLDGADTEAFTLDECLFACHREVLDHVSFNSTLCDGWHLYAGELCLQAHERGIAVRVLDGAGITHCSVGRPDKTYFRTLYRIARHHRKSYAFVTFTCGWSPTALVPAWMVCHYLRIKEKVASPRRQYDTQGKGGRVA